MSRGPSAELRSGLELAGVGVTRPLLRVSVDADGLVVAPSSRLLGWMGVPGFSVRWTDVERIHELYGPLPDSWPFGGRRGVRLVLRSRGLLTHRRGLARVFGRVARRPVLRLVEDDVARLLALAPPTSPNATQSPLAALRLPEQLSPHESFATQAITMPDSLRPPLECLE